MEYDTLVATICSASFLGALGSAALVYTTRKRASILHRLLFVISLMDFFTSLHFMADPFLLPKHTREWGLNMAYGTQATCSAITYVTLVRTP